MRLDFIPKHRAKITAITALAEKLGQKDTKPALCITMEGTFPNTILDKLDPTGSTRRYFFRKNSMPAKGQAAIDGVEAVSDLPELTDPAKWLGDQSWAEEQTGCTLTVYQGVSNKLVLKDCTVDKLSLKFQEGGGVALHWNIYSSTDIDVDIAGEFCLLKQHEVDFELTLPEVLQQSLTEQRKKGNKLTPIEGLKAADDKAKGKADTPAAEPVH